MENLPEYIVAQFLHPNGEEVTLGELGEEFLKENGIGADRVNEPFRVAIYQKTSKAENIYYEYQQNGLPLPDGLDTFTKVDGALVPMKKQYKSKKGNPTRDGETQILVGGIVYKVTTLITQGKDPFYLKIIAHKKPSAGGKGARKPKGGAIL